MKINIQPTLVGKKVTLRPLLRNDFSGLYKAASDPIIWETHPDSTRYKEDVFQERFFEGAITSGGALTVIDNESGHIIGSSRYYKFLPDKHEISIGYTFLEKAVWGSGINQEIKALMLEHIFSSVNTVWFGVGEINLRSRKAVEKLGATLSRKAEKELDGKPYVQLYYKLEAPEYNA
ncbi:MAG: GNAT family N-acetyltransferase [Pseudomonadales bacterium]